MPRKISINIPPFVGSVTLAEPMTLEQVIALEDAQDAAAEENSESPFLKRIVEARGDDREARAIWASRADRHFIPVICKCVERWDIENYPEHITPETFPATPRGKSIELIRTLMSELMAVYNGETSVPNES
ncbi:MAG: hypothetical protein ACOY4M_08345 [Pseudomonadota bacterium]